MAPVLDPATVGSLSVEPLKVSVGLVASSLSRRAGGVFHSLVELANAIARLRAIDVRVYGLHDEWLDADRAHWRTVEPIIFPCRPPAAFGWAPGLGRALHDPTLDLVHLHGLWMYPSLAALRWRRRTERPVVISPHGMLDPWALSNSAWKKRIARLLFEDANLGGAACLHALNVAEADALRDLGLANPIAVIPNGVDLPDLSRPYQSPPWLPDDGRRVLLYIGRLHPKKGLRNLVRAWAKLKVRAPDTAMRWNLVIAGWDDGGHAQALVNEIVAKELAGSVLLLGPVYGEAKAALFKHAHAFILPSHSEGLPMAVLEAWAYGLPVFMTAACNLAEGFAAGAAVEISPRADALARELAEGLADGALANRGSRGRELVASRFAWDGIANDHAAVYRWLVHGGALPPCVRIS